MWEVFLYDDKIIQMDRDRAEVLPRRVPPPSIGGVDFGPSLTLATDRSVDLSDCANDAQVNSLRYCSDQDEINDTVSKSFICVDVPLVRSSCSSVGGEIEDELIQQ